MKKTISIIVGILLTTTAFANDIRIVVPFGPGGQTDRVARMVQRDLKEIGGKNSIVEYKPGGNGEIATNYMAQVGKTSTVFMVISTPMIFAGRPQSAESQEIEAVVDIGYAPLLVVAPANGKFTRFQDFIAADKDQVYNYANAGRAGMASLAGAILTQGMNKNFVGVTYPGASKMLIDLIAGRLDFTVLAESEVMPYIEKQQLIPLATLSDSRLAGLPTVPTVKEFNIRDSVLQNHYLIIGPRSNSRTDVAFIQSVMTRSLNDPVTSQPYRQEKLRFTTGNKALDAHWWQQEVSRWRDLLSRTNFKTE
jgi:tripartite-type tricarboxylate transporter receptor subunit TctC